MFSPRHGAVLMRPMPIADSHSLVIDRWGTAIADTPHQEGVNVASLDLQVSREVRVQLPSLANRRLACQHAQAHDGAMNQDPRTPVTRHVVAEERPR